MSRNIYALLVAIDDYSPRSPSFAAASTTSTPSRRTCPSAWQETKASQSS